MRTIKARPSSPRVRCNGVYSWRTVRAESTLHGVVMVESRWLRNLGRSLSSLGCGTVDTALLRRSQDGARPTSVLWVVEEAPDIMYEERVKEFCYLFFVGEI
jgi:hypothetical protein